MGRVALVAGNSKRPGATRTRVTGRPASGSGGRNRQGLEGKGPTPKAVDRKGHKAYRDQPVTRDDRTAARSRPSSRRTGSAQSEWVAGRNAVVEALEASIPVSALYVAERLDRDDRVKRAFKLASLRGLNVLEVTRSELDTMTDRAVHQGLALKVPPYEYADPHELLDRAADNSQAALIVALDSVTDPRNLGAVVRSAAAFGVHGVVVPERRSAGLTASAWKTSAGAAARMPVARATNLTRQLRAFQDAGLMVVGLDGSGETELGDLDAADPMVLVVGSEGGGLSRLVKQTCDLLVRIPVAASTESLNASVAAGIALYEIDTRRRATRGS